VDDVSGAKMDYFWGMPIVWDGALYDPERAISAN
jgi:hypothetical protein